MIIIKNKKIITGLLIGSLALLCFASGAIASSHLTKITAYINSAISVELKGKPLNLSQAKPISYNDTTYLPLRTIAEATGLDVKWNQEEQRIQLNEKSASVPGEKVAFSKNNVLYSKSYATDLLLKPTDINFSDKKYNEVIKISSINSSATYFYLTFPEGTQNVGVTFGAEGKNSKITYTIYDLDGYVVSVGDLKPNDSTYVEFELSDAGTELKFSFKGVGDNAYLVYDESWYQ